MGRESIKGTVRGVNGSSSSSLSSSPAPVKLSEMASSGDHVEDSPYFAGWRAYEEDPYDAETNPKGVIQMGLAENQVSFDLLEEYLENHGEASSWGSASFKENALFQDYHGLTNFRKGMSLWMEKVRGGRAVFDPDRIVLTAGATAANEILTFILANPGDAILVPTPYYPGFDRDLRWRTGVNIVPVHCTSSNGFKITMEALQSSFSEAETKNMKPKAILITNPSNPLGTTLDRTTLETIFVFASARRIHIISDEIYSGSVFFSGDGEFVGVSELVEAIDPSLVHVVYSLSKDLGLPGFRVGVIYSYNDKVVKTARRMSSFSLVSSQTQRMLACMLSDEDFTEKYLKTNKERLRKRHEFVVEALKSSGIGCFEGNAGLFCWMNMKPFLFLVEEEEEEKEEEGEEDLKGRELKLWKLLLREAKVNISPGSSCRCDEAGWFRVCFANIDEETLGVAINRLKDLAAKLC